MVQKNEFEEATDVKFQTFKKEAYVYVLMNDGRYQIILKAI